GGSIGRTTAGNNNLVISNNDVRESSNGSWPGCGILVGTAATGTVTPSLYNNNGVISNNNVFNICAPAGFNSIFINVTNWNSNWTVSGNSVYNTAPRAYPTTFFMLQVVSTQSQGNFVVSNNFAGGSAPQCGGSAFVSTDLTTAVTLVGMNIFTAPPGQITFTGNKISNIVHNSASTGNIFTGVQYPASSPCADMLFDGNTIGGTGSADSIRCIGSGNGGLVWGIFAQASSVSANSNVLSNNTIANIRVTNAVVSGSTASPLQLVSTITGILVQGGNAGIPWTVQGNTIGGPTMETGLQAANPTTLSTSNQLVCGIRSAYSGNLLLSGNTVRNLLNNSRSAGSSNTLLGNHQTVGMALAAGLNFVSNNTVSGLQNSSPNPQTNTAASVIGIAVQSTTGAQSITGNTVHSLSNTDATNAPVGVVGIMDLITVTPTTFFGKSTIAKNNVHSLSVASQNPLATLYGIAAINRSADIFNNMVRLGIDASGTSISSGNIMVGILKQQTLTNTSTLVYAPGNYDVNVLHNSVFIGGSGVNDGSNTFAYRRLLAQTSPGLDRVFNNVFVNSRSNVSGATSKHYAMAIDGTTNYQADNNLVSAANNGGTLFGIGNPFITADYPVISGWRGVTGTELNSAVGVPNFVNALGTSSTVDLHVQNPTPIEASGSAASFISQIVTDDFDGQTRSSNTPVDIGADAGT
ncbi:MAG: hypothetical protein ACKO9V_00070, partial [Candidatus Kapaibacterium sp.]